MRERRVSYKSMCVVGVSRYACVGSHSECVLTTDCDYGYHWCRETFITMNCRVLYAIGKLQRRVASPIGTHGASRGDGDLNVIEKAFESTIYRFGSPIARRLSRDRYTG